MTSCLGPDQLSRSAPSTFGMRGQFPSAPAEHTRIDRAGGRPVPGLAGAGSILTTSLARYNLILSGPRSNVKERMRWHLTGVW